MSNSQSPDDGVDQPRQSVYVESEIIMTTVRVVAPFAFTYGLFLTFHGGGSPGGGFQGGAIIGSTILMIAFGFGIEPTRDWIENRSVTLLASGGVLAFATLGLLPIVLGGRFLQHDLFKTELGIPHGTKYALEAVEIVGVAPIVAGVVVGLFFAIAAGMLGDTAPVSQGGEAE
ncbi:MnhB domain-containing protein [Natronoarchaeum sp. GCM10025321]|uniref:MnhB domain-containing protein n=2 Tax=unclassified Natronoarchaeum TaxID=2620183 RepID=UPI00360D24C5